MALIRIKDLTRHYAGGDETVQALRGVNLAIEDGEFVTIMGQSGSGKSTLLSVLGGMNHPTAGEVEMAGVRLYDLTGEQLADFRAEKLGFVFQSFHLVPSLSTLENVMFPAELRGDGAAREKAEALLARVGLTGRAASLPHQLSGGERQRCAICRALVNDPRIIFADEPTGNLDSVNGRGILDILLELHRERRTTLVLVTHSPEIARTADRVVRLHDGRIQAP